MDAGRVSVGNPDGVESIGMTYDLSFNPVGVEDEFLAIPG